MRIHISVEVTDTDPETAKDLQKMLVRRILTCEGQNLPTGPYPATVNLDSGEIRPIEEEEPESVPLGSTFEPALRELNGLLSTILNLPQEEELRKMRDLVDRALYGLALQARRSNKLRPSWDRNCLHYTDDRLAAAVFKLSDDRWTGFFLCPEDSEPTPLSRYHTTAASAQQALRTLLADLGVLTAVQP